MRHIITFYTNHPWVGFVGTVASVVGLVLALYLYMLSRRYPDVTVAIEPTRARLVTGGHTSAIRVFAGDKEVTSDVTALEASIWNRGTEPVRSGDVLEPIRLLAEPGVPILEAHLLRVTRPVAGIVLDTSRQSEGAIGITFTILEPGDGATIQIIYAGSADQRFRTTGAVVGQKSVSVAWRPHMYGPEDRSPRASFVWIALICIGIAAGFLAALIRAAAEPGPASGLLQALKLFFLSQILFFGYVAFDAIRNAVRMARPPF